MRAGVAFASRGPFAAALRPKPPVIRCSSLASSSTPLLTSTTTSPDHISFIRDVSASRVPEHLHCLLNMLQVRGDTIISPGARDGMIPLIIPLSESPSGALTSLLRWPTAPPGMEMPVVEVRKYGVWLLAKNVDQYIHRILVEDDADDAVSLDVFRGITVALMILVDEAGGFFPSINHSPWNGVTLADFVMPFFLFIVGVALALAYKNVPDRVDATRKAVLRALKLFIVGLILQGGYFHGVQSLTFGVDILNIRFMGVLQRISIAYLVAALCQIWLRNEEDVDSGDSLIRKYRYQLFVGLIITSIYLALLYGLYVPDWEYQIPVDGSESKLFSVTCGVRGDTGPACNAVGMIDRKVLGIHHLYRRPIYARTKQCSINSPDTGPLPADAPSWCQAPFDPEGLLSSVMAIVTCLIGLQFGHVIVHFKEHRDRFIQWMIPSLFLLALAFALDFCGIHMNKALYSFSYTCATAGIAGALFTGIYLLVDVYGYRRPTIVMEWMGMNALLIYVLVACNLLPILIQGFYWKEPRNNILRLVGVGS